MAIPLATMAFAEYRILSGVGKLYDFSTVELDQATFLCGDTLNRVQKISVIPNIYIGTARNVCARFPLARSLLSAWASTGIVFPKAVGCTHKC